MSLSASDSWGISISFISIIFLPIVGNAAEHAGSIIFTFKNKLDISLGVALGSATQISMFVVPFCVLVAWIMHVDMDLDFSLLETAVWLSLLSSQLSHVTGETSFKRKRVILVLCYVDIAACFFVYKVPQGKKNSFGQILLSLRCFDLFTNLILVSKL
ncbi:Vacuolar cation/proton exchanger 1a [Linum grandiflorum]